MRRKGVRSEVERIEHGEGALLDALLKARQQAGLSQAQLAKRMDKHSPSIATVRTYVNMCGKRLVLCVA